MLNTNSIFKRPKIWERDLTQFINEICKYMGDSSKSLYDHGCKKYKPDLLFYDWGLHHFHLGFDIANNGRVFRTQNKILKSAKSVEKY